MIRVLQDGPLDGPTNMARDEVLLTCVGRSESPPTLRIYQWESPTISLGYFQRYADYDSLPPPAGSLLVVRRLTGGGAILHDLELTYSLTLPKAHRLLAKGANRLYELVHDAVIAALASLGLTATQCGTTDNSSPRRGPFFCFERRHCYDLLIGHDKITGSAQRRRRDAILQHGSIILGNRLTQQASATVPLPFDEAVRLMRSHLVTHLAEATEETFQPDHWCTAELAAADEFLSKYAADAWTKRT